MPINQFKDVNPILDVRNVEKVDDPDVPFEEYRRKGVIGDGVQVRDTDWGTREFGFRDLDGNGLIFYRDL